MWIRFRLLGLGSKVQDFGSRVLEFREYGLG